MSSTAVSWALYDAPRCDPTSRLVLVYLAERTDRHGRSAFPAVPTIAADLDVSVSTVRRRLDDLEDRGLITRGDQELVSHVRADHRPIVWNLALDRRRDSDDMSAVTPRPRPRRVSRDTSSEPDDMSAVTRRGTTDDVSAGAPRRVRNRSHDVSLLTHKPRPEPRTEPKPPPARAPEPVAALGGGGGPRPEQAPEQASPAAGVLADVAASWDLPPAALTTRPALLTATSTALGAWPADALAVHLAADPPAGLRSPAALAGRRLADLPTGPGACGCRGCAAWRRAADRADARTREQSERAARAAEPPVDLAEHRAARDRAAGARAAAKATVDAARLRRKQARPPA